MKKLISVVSAVFACALISAQNLSGYDIMKKSKELDNSKSSESRATMEIVNKKGSKRVREVLMKEKDFGNEKKSVIVFLTPKDVSGVAYLSIEYSKKSDGSKKDSDNWLYMPAMKKTRRISSSESEGDFMGTDFTYSDMDELDLDEENYTLSGIENLDGVECYKINAVRKDSSKKEPKRIIWIGCEDFMMRKAEFFDRQNKLHRILSCEDISKIDSYYTCSKMTMKNVQTEHFTVLTRTQIAFDKEISDNIFTVAALERGNIR
ncbi:outer membrane lipoprotein-sorting protein [Treponema sp.]|uniref:outer membrane lipoprotein-sorting protein n=1 Tax=Treponema sp. TaxID=166 RepID=UPI00388D6EFD